ncbi:MAG: hypothetical protein CVU07_08235 [Bacteroidetes bacterium HGW-Bacteroidetes-23]|nr:MAG: hypothetical protein CVU07_08235 [Bacteroidetes bacterium HGW-Bacteroidetes-23]
MHEFFKACSSLQRRGVGGEVLKAIEKNAKALSKFKTLTKLNPNQSLIVIYGKPHQKRHKPVTHSE